MTVSIATDPVNDPSALASSVIALTVWLSDPAVMTAVASLLTAAAAYWRSRHRRPTVEPPAAHPTQATPHHAPPSLAEAYSTLHDAEEKIREELLQQLQHLQEEAERIGRDLTYFRKATANLEERIIRCPETTCPLRRQLKAT